MENFEYQTKNILTPIWLNRRRISRVAMIRRDPVSSSAECDVTVNMSSAQDNITDYEIAVSESDVADLHERLEKTRWPSTLDDVGWLYGADTQFVRDLAQYWRTGYDWRARAAALNRWSHHRAGLSLPDVQGGAPFGVHFVHVKGTGPNPLPLVLSHGWPSSFIEYLSIAERLADPAAHGGDPADAFHVVVPSLPGYGFSDVPTRPGMTPRRIAELWAALMEALGYPRFGAHGCDWGAYVTALLGLDHADRVEGVHMGMLSLGAPGRSNREKSPEEAAYVERRKAWGALETGYQEIQGTKPQTLAFGLTDSPAGLAAWIVEKWRSWTDCGGDLFSVIDRDTVLDNISVYWFSGTINSASRLYYESRRNPVALEKGQRVETPSGFFLETAPAQRANRGRPEFLEAGRIGAPPRDRVEMAFNVQRWFEAPEGGHFPALETPDMLVDEIRSFFRPLR